MQSFLPLFRFPLPAVSLMGGWGAKTRVQLARVYGKGGIAESVESSPVFPRLLFLLSPSLTPSIARLRREDLSLFREEK